MCDKIGEGPAFAGGPPSEGGPRDDQTGLVFHSLFRAHHNAIHAGLAERGARDLGSPQLLMVIRELTETNGCPPSQRELAGRMRLSPATIATSLKSLERNGYVERAVDPADTRRNQISITRRAEEALEAGRAVFRSVDAAMLAGFTREEVEALNRFHRRMLENLYQVGGDREAPCPPPEVERERDC